MSHEIKEKKKIRDLDECTLGDISTEELESHIEESAEVWDHWGLPILSFDDCEYAIAEDYDAAMEAAKSNIKDLVWAFNADFLSSYLVGGKLTAEQINDLRGDSCEGCNEALLAMIDDFDTFAGDAISADGMAHFLSPYDGNETEIGDYLLYRIN